jgi:uncharacterized protein YbaA (DUF1428 family)
MTYVDGSVLAVPAASKEIYRNFAAEAATLCKEFGATRTLALCMKAMGDQMPFDGKPMTFGGFAPLLDA